VEIGHTSDVTPLRATVKVQNPRGLHMRAAFAFAKVAGRFRSNIKVRNDSKIADGKSGTRLMTLGATPETELVLEVAGEDAEAALPVLTKALGAPSADDLRSLLD
jgi:phosphocarrier protein HPr